jgi:outer membrane protein TolC
MNETDYVASNTVSGEMPEHPPEFDPAIAVPPTVTEPSRPENWKVRLEDVLRMGIENSKQIAVVKYRPGEAGAAVEEQLATFDPFFSAGFAFGRSRPNVLGVFDSPQQFTSFNGAAGYGTNATAGAASQFGLSSIPGSSMAGLSKRNATGGLTTLGFSVNSLMANPSDDLQKFSPLWTSNLSVGIEQPLLQGAGVEFNRSLILIAQAGKKQADFNFETDVRQLARDLERSYWDLYFAYKNLESQEIGMRLSLAIWDAEKTQLDARAATEADVAQARSQYETFRDARLQALDQVLGAEAACDC